MSKLRKNRNSSRSIHQHLIRHLREWHRKLGIISVFFLIFLSLSGIALNHTEGLNLAHKPITATWLLDHYGIKPPSDVRYFADQKVNITDRFIWLNETLLIETDSNIISIAELDNFLLILTSDELIIYTLDGQLVDKLNSASGLPDNITAMALTDQHVVVNTPAGYYQSDRDFISWQVVHFVTEPQWVVETKVNHTELAQAENRYRAQYLNLERIILDAHSGRILGTFGVILMDIVAIILIILSLSGAYIWLRYTRAKR